MPSFNPYPLSHTKAAKFRRCRLAFSRQYVERRPEATGVPGTVGKAFHDWADEAGAQEAMSGPLDEVSLYRILARKAATIDEAAAPMLRRLVSRYISRGGLPPIPQDAQDVVREQPLAMTLDGEPVAWKDPRAQFRCRVDLAWTEHGTLGVIRDWKTGRTIEDVDATDQMRWYGGALAILNPALERVQAELHYVRFAPGGIRRTPEPYEADALRATVPEELRAIAEAMQGCATADEWPAALGDHCRWCSYSGDCPAFRATVPPLRPIETIEQAREAADDLLRLKSQLKDYEDALRSWTLHNGGIVFPDGEVLGHHQRDRRSVCDPQVAVEFFRGAGVPEKDLWELLALSFTDAEKLAKGLAAGAARGQKQRKTDALLQELADLGATRVVTGSAFSRKKPASEEADDELPEIDFGPED